MISSSNHWLQATPGFAFWSFAAQRLGAPEPECWAPVRTVVKTSVWVLFSILLVPACTHVDLRQRASDGELRERLVGSWWFDNYSSTGPFCLVTFKPDGRCTSLSTNSPKQQVRDGYWRVTTNGTLLITKDRGALPHSNDEMFILDRMTDTEMVFGHPSVAGRMTFRK